MSTFIHMDNNDQKTFLNVLISKILRFVKSSKLIRLHCIDAGSGVLEFVQTKFQKQLKKYENNLKPRIQSA